MRLIMIVAWLWLLPAVAGLLLPSALLAALVCPLAGLTIAWGLSFYRSVLENLEAD